MNRVSPRAGYPLNYNNYKVCREVSPGVKECLILETGEHVVYDCTNCKGAGAPPVSLSQGPQRPGVDRVKRNLCKSLGSLCGMLGDCACAGSASHTCKAKAKSVKCSFLPNPM